MTGSVRYRVNSHRLTYLTILALVVKEYMSAGFTHAPLSLLALLALPSGLRRHSTAATDQVCITLAATGAAQAASSY